MKKAKLLLSTFISCIAVALIFSTALVFVGCGHKHSFGEWQITAEATHQAEGQRERVCTKCGEKQTEKIDKVPHSFSEWTTSVQATCKNVGQETRSCECGEVEYREVAKLKHTWGEWETTLPSLCFNDGSTRNGTEQRECIACKTVEQREVVGSHHIIIEEAVEPTCTTEGMTERHYCDACGYEELPSHTLQATGHDYSQFAPNHDVDLSQTHNGTHSKKCANCNDVVTEPCIYDTTNIPATCEDNGYNIHTCQICHDSFEHDQETYPALGHAYEIVHINDNGHHYHQKVCANNPEHITERADCTGNVMHVESTCYENGYDQTTCDVCHEVFRSNPLPLKEHTYGSWQYVRKGEEDYHEHTCTVPECMHTESFHCQNSYNIIPATCETQTQIEYRCSVCENSYTKAVGAKLEHKYTTWQHESGTTSQDSMHKHSCTVCGKEETLPCHMVEAQKSPATCTADEVVGLSCQDCGFSYDVSGQGATGHSFGDWSLYEAGKNGQHQHTCERCHQTFYESCSFSFTVEEPNCTEAGSQIFTCTTEGCGNTYTEVIEALGHKYVEPGQEEDYNEWVITEETHTRPCLRPDCEHIDISTHTYDDSNFCSGCGHDGLIYKEEDDYYVVFSDDRVLTAKHIIISEKHRDLESGKELYVRRIEGGYYDRKRVSFQSNHTIETLEMPKTIRSIGDYAFDYCINLRSVTITGSDAPDFTSDLVSIGNYAFQTCYSLETAHFPSSLQTIGHSAFAGCKKLNSIIIPDSVTEIGRYAFDDTAYVENSDHWTNYSLYIGAHLIRVSPSIQGAYRVASNTKTISEEAFRDCIYLSKITLPDSIVEIDADAFVNCVGLKEVVFEGTFAQWIRIIFANDNASPMSYASSLNIAGAIEDIVIDDGITSIPAGTFKNTGIKSISLPASLTTIGEEAFENCASLTTITFRGESQLSRVMANAFTNSAYYLAPENWENGVLYVGNVVVKVTDAAGESPVLVTEKHTKVTGIAAKAFEGNTTVKHVVIPTDACYIGADAFTGTTLQTLLFDDPNNWFAKTPGGMGRLLKPSGTDGGRSNASAILNLYSSEWIKNYHF